MKNDICDFIQNEVRQKINLHNQEEYQKLIDKKLITNLGKKIEFLKSETTTKNEMIKKLLNNVIRENKSCNMVVVVVVVVVGGGGCRTWDFDDC